MSRLFLVISLVGWNILLMVSVMNSMLAVFLKKEPIVNHKERFCCSVFHIFSRLLVSMEAGNCSSVIYQVPIWVRPSDNKPVMTYTDIDR